MKSITAHCDLTTGEIHGCKEGSWKWYHEKGHFEFNKNPKFSFLILIQGYLQSIWIFFIMLSVMWRFFFFFSLSIGLVHFWIFIFEEKWCNRYADEHYNLKYRNVYKCV